LAEKLAEVSDRQTKGFIVTRHDDCKTGFSQVAMITDASPTGRDSAAPFRQLIPNRERNRPVVAFLRRYWVTLAPAAVARAV
jgi:hypothetical protein